MAPPLPNPGGKPSRSMVAPSSRASPATRQSARKNPELECLRVAELALDALGRGEQAHEDSRARVRDRETQRAGLG